MSLTLTTLPTSLLPLLATYLTPYEQLQLTHTTSTFYRSTELQDHVWLTAIQHTRWLALEDNDVQAALEHCSLSCSHNSSSTTVTIDDDVDHATSSTTHSNPVTTYRSLYADLRQRDKLLWDSGRETRYRKRLLDWQLGNTTLLEYELIAGDEMLDHNTSTSAIDQSYKYFTSYDVFNPASLKPRKRLTPVITFSGNTHDHTIDHVMFISKRHKYSYITALMPTLGCTLAGVRGGIVATLASAGVKYAMIDSYLDEYGLDKTSRREQLLSACKVLAWNSGMLLWHIMCRSMRLRFQQQYSGQLPAWYATASEFADILDCVWSVVWRLLPRTAIAGFPFLIPSPLR